MPEMFALPLELKQTNKSSVYYGYIGQITDVPYESLCIPDAPSLESVERFAGMLWPEGNQKFCNTVTTYAQQVRNLEQIVERMIFQSLGSGLPTEEAKVSLLRHVDPNLITIVRQNGVEGLEVYTKDGECIRVVPSPDTFTIMIGETMMRAVHLRTRIQLGIAAGGRAVWLLARKILVCHIGGDWAVGPFNPCCRAQLLERAGVGTRGTNAPILAGASSWRCRMASSRSITIESRCLPCRSAIAIPVSLRAIAGTSLIGIGSTIIGRRRQWWFGEPALELDVDDCHVVGVMGNRVMGGWRVARRSSS
ncbi:2-oxoglutarate-dependent dioxygenase AOP1.2 [Carex littledalei]|uniref:2-oxoglutarate-dependent dioxygenase AOP1.2 n=1 Tax=Carex littledalei TaxID=544730 RepID=A0A833QMI6_9POAL|nr:2-oxoglutarate-dependent dioxygenase AOP1.2 [Carex littledalei]